MERRCVKAFGLGTFPEDNLLLPSITGGKMLDHSLTSFQHVRLPAEAMLGDLAMPSNMRDQYLSAINRLGNGALALSLWIIPFLKCATFVVGKYSQSRTVQQGMRGGRVPIISFRTQQLPILHALAQIAVMEAFADWITDLYSTDVSLHPAAKDGLGNGQGSLANLIERSGAQGVYPHNQMAAFESLTRATGIAEGEIQVLSIRLATELLIDRYKIPEATNPNCFLAQHESGIRAELQELQANIKDHRSADYNNYILPHCRSMILAIGQRMAYEASTAAGIDPALLALYEAGAIKADSSWFVEKMGLSRTTQFEMECKALNAILPRLGEYLDSLDVEPYCTAPMLSPDRWDGIIDDSPSFAGNAKVNLDFGEKFASKL
ncbi:acyl-CoA oxidase [Penicillium verhagenii]|uniref:acyl-CoA oxidase n=1 Tax=Penicillium verhagenii TaxID=1562060 RepID=UPI002545AFB5|nr:acyl-CoA oxidase [Penicillium verhagenii]KAJ5924134.1 acyl-CoA oxidase [Penicillium verhagenii]